MRHSPIATLTLSQQGYDPFIDFLKGVSIVCVILNHCLPLWLMDWSAFFFWGVSAVPVFILIQVFHAYKSGTGSCRWNVCRVWSRVLWPFLLCQLLIALLLLLHDEAWRSRQGVLGVLSLLIRSGGIGPGAYYPWIYAEMALLLPLVAPLAGCRRLQGWRLCLLFVIVSQAAETACAVFAMPQLAYRLLLVRYIFLIYLGYLLATRGLVLDWRTLTAASISLAVSAYIVYGQPHLHPLLYTFVNPVCHWFCYLYVAYLLLFILRGVYCRLPRGRLRGVLLWCGRYSYELFLLQMICFAAYGLMNSE